MAIINRHDLYFGGMPAILRALEALAAHVDDLRNRLDLLEYADAQRVQRIAALELALAPQTASEPPTGPAETSGGIIADSWLPASWIQDYTAAVEG